MTAPSDFNSISELDATLVFRVAYDGSSYSGFAVQPGQTTVAGELRRAIETLLRRPIDLTCAGRTDAGVHAVAQFISVPVTDAELALTRRRWLRAMDALLPKDIAINEVYKARKGFSARFDARSRTYTYRIADRDARPVLSRGAVWWHRYPLDVEAMSAACPALLGEQDFKSFCKVASAVGKPTHRCVMRAEFGHEVAFGEDILTFTIEGNAFLHSMVRTIVGTLVEIGMHRREPEWMREVIDACDRTAAGPTALPAALRLWAWITIPPSLSCSTRGGLGASCVGTCHLWAARVQHLFLACNTTGVSLLLLPGCTMNDSLIHCCREDG